MSVQSEINRISGNVANTYSALEEQGATLPASAQQTSANLASTVATIPTAGKIITTEGSSTAYTATVPGITELKPGVSFVMIPHVTSASTSPTLNVNGLGAKGIRQPLTTNTSTYVVLSSSTFLVANRPIQVMYNGYVWIVNITKADGANLNGRVPVANGGVPSCTTSNNGQFLRVVSGVATWTTVDSAEGASF